MAVGFSIGTKGYIGTGENTYSIFSTFWEWDQGTNIWTQKANLPGGPRIGAVGFSIGNKGYIGTGQGADSFGNPVLLDDFWEWDQVTNTWSQKANLPGGPRSWAVGFSIGNKGYIGTGTGVATTYDDFWEWDHASNTWSQKTSITGGTRLAAVGFSIGTKGYIGTGQDKTTGSPIVLDDFWAWDQATNIWKQKANIPIARSYATGFSIGSYGFIGTGQYGISLITSDWWRYDTCNNAWTQAVNFGGGHRTGTVGFSIGCKGYVGTGVDLSGTYFKDFWEYDPALSSMLATVSASSNPLCWGQTATLAAGSGCGIIGYSWSTGATTNSIIVTPTATTTYSVCVVTLCDSSTGTVTINVDPMITHSFSNVTILNCFGDNNGSATVNVAGGTPPFSYSWNTIPVQTTSTATGLAAGTHIVTVTEVSYGCSFTDTITITSPPQLTHSFASVTNINCFGNSNGSASVNVAGGTPTYTYSWSCVPVQTTATATGLGPGTYSVFVTDAHGCSFADTISITQPALPLTHSLPPVTNLICFGNNIGSATVNVSGGTPSYTYLWSSVPVQTTPTATGLGPGNYTVTVTDFYGCSFSDTITITSPPLLTHLFSNVNVDCFGNNNGSASVSAAGGTPSYTYSWNSIPVQTTPTITGLYAGVYSVTITDSHGCSFSDTAVIKSPTGLTVIPPVITNANCFGANTGTATVTATGGTPGYNYSWNPTAQTSSTATGLAASVYTITVTDNNGCIIKTLAQVTQPTAVTASISSNTSICPGTSATENVIASGGTSGYTYLWMPSGAATTSIIISPSATTTYTALVTDANGCSAPPLLTTVTVAQYPASSITYTPDLCGSGLVQFTDNSTNTIWDWHFGDGDSASTQNPVHIYSAPGSYPVTLLSFVGTLSCKTISQLMVDVPPFSQLYIPNAFSPNDDGRDDMYYVFGKCIAEMTFKVFDRWGEKVFETSDPAVGWDGRYKGQMENAGVFMYEFNGTLTTGEKINRKGNITLMR